LVGFDEHGNRLGMGGGFYDRMFAYRRMRSSWGGPQLLGLAHSCQKVEVLPVKSWDIPLNGIVTDAECILFSTS
jgi:5-formyltetrahydrofolate cyclo-ligase